MIRSEKWTVVKYFWLKRWENKKIGAELSDTLRPAALWRATMKNCCRLSRQAIHHAMTRKGDGLFWRHSRTGANRTKGSSPFAWRKRRRWDQLLRKLIAPPGAISFCRFKRGAEAKMCRFSKNLKSQINSGIAIVLLITFAHCTWHAVQELKTISSQWPQ